MKRRRGTAFRLWSAQTPPAYFRTASFGMPPTFRRACRAATVTQRSPGIPRLSGCASSSPHRPARLPAGSPMKRRRGTAFRLWSAQTRHAYFRDGFVRDASNFSQSLPSRDGYGAVAGITRLSGCASSSPCRPARLPAGSPVKRRRDTAFRLWSAQTRPAYFRMASFQMPPTFRRAYRAAAVTERSPGIPRLSGCASSSPYRPARLPARSRIKPRRGTAFRLLSAQTRHAYFRDGFVRPASNFSQSLCPAGNIGNKLIRGHG